MRAEKQYINEEYIKRLKESPFFVVVDYQGLKVEQFSELRNRLHGVGAEMHVVKNTIFRIAAKEVGLADLKGQLSGQTAAVTGQGEIAAAAKVLKNFRSEFDKPVLKFGYLDNQLLDGTTLETLADLPSLEVLRGQLLGVLQAPATQLVRLLNEPGTRLARVLKARADKGE